MDHSKRTESIRGWSWEHGGVILVAPERYYTLLSYLGPQVTTANRGLGGIVLLLPTATASIFYQKKVSLCIVIFIV